MFNSSRRTHVGRNWFRMVISVSLVTQLTHDSERSFEALQISSSINIDKLPRKQDNFQNAKVLTF